MQIRFIAKKVDLDDIKEAKIRLIVAKVADLIELPSSIEILIKELPGHLYGQLDLMSINRITLNSILTLDELMEVLVHELIHVHQKHKGYLKQAGSDIVFWKNKFYEKPKNIETNVIKHQTYPWEIDVAEKLQTIYPLIVNEIGKTKD